MMAILNSKGKKDNRKAGEQTKLDNIHRKVSQNTREAFTEIGGSEN